MSRQEKTKTVKGDPKKEAMEELKSSVSHMRESAEEHYKKGKQKISEIESEVEVYASKLAKNVQKHPLTALLIAGGIGFILSSIIRK